jgi:hypothetical protein
MSSLNQKRPETPTAQTSQSGIVTEFFVGLATGPVLLGVLSAGAIFSWLQAAGLASEEVFRGDRLPVLHFPESEREE